MFHPQSDRQFQDEKSCGSKVPKGKCKKTTMWSSPLCNKACSFMVKIITIKTRFYLFIRAITKLKKQKDPHLQIHNPPPPFEKISPKSKLPTTQKKKSSSSQVLTSLQPNVHVCPSGLKAMPVYAWRPCKAPGGTEACPRQSCQCPWWAAYDAGVPGSWNHPWRNRRRPMLFWWWVFWVMCFLFLNNNRVGFKKMSKGHFLPEIWSFTYCIFFFKCVF